MRACVGTKRRSLPGDTAPVHSCSSEFTLFAAKQNQLFAALPAAELERSLAQLEAVDLPLGPVMHVLLPCTQALITQMAQTAVCNCHHSLDRPGLEAAACGCYAVDRKAYTELMD